MVESKRVNKTLSSSVFVVIAGVSCVTALAADPYTNQTRIRQLEIDQRMDQVQHDLKTQSEASVNSMHRNSQRTFSPTLPGYSSMPRSSHREPDYQPTKEQIDRFLEGLGDPDKETGIYAYPAVDRLYYYGLLCIETGFVSEGIRALTEHTRIQAEAAAQK